MSFHWGIGIGLFYGLFMVAMVAVVLRSTQYDHALVSDEYYAEDLRYQEHYDKLANARKLKEKPEMRLAEDRRSLQFTFPEGMRDVAGEVTFFRPSDESADFSVPLTLGPDNTQHISTERLEPGLWKVKIDWSAGETPFFTEEVLVL